MQTDVYHIMNRKMSVKKAVLLFVMVLVALTSCAAATNDAYFYNEKEQVSYTESYDPGIWDATTSEISGSNTASSESSVDSISTAQNDLENRKLIRTAALDIETQSFTDCIARLEENIAKIGGYVESASVYGNESYALRSADYTVRVPEENYTTFLNGMDGIGSVTHRTESVDDITMSYTDVESRIRSLETEYETLLAILEKCDTVSDVIEVQNRITVVTGELDSYYSRLRTYDNLISYCTVRISVSEVRVYTEPTENISLWQRITQDVQANYVDLADDMIEFFIWFVSALPVLLILALLVFCIVRVVRRIRRKKVTTSANTGGKTDDQA